MKTKTNTQVWLMSLVLVLICSFAATAQQANFDPNNAVILTPTGAKPYAPVKKDGSTVDGVVVSQPQSLTPELSATRQQAGFPVAFSEKMKTDMANGVQNTEALMNAFIAQFKAWMSSTKDWEKYMSVKEMEFINKDDLPSLWKYNFYQSMGTNK